MLDVAARRAVHRERPRPARRRWPAAVSARSSSARTRCSAAASAAASPGGTSRRVDVGPGHVAVAGQVGGHDRRPGRHRLEQHDAERLAPRATARRTRRPPRSRAIFSSSLRRPEPLDPRVAGELRLQRGRCRARRGRPSSARRPGSSPARRAAPRGPCGARGGRRRRSSGPVASAMGRTLAVALDLDAVEERRRTCRRGSARPARGRRPTPRTRRSRRPASQFRLRLSHAVRRAVARRRGTCRPSAPGA